MAARTISAYADEKTASVVEQIAALEDRSPAQIAAAALRFYVRLPAEVHSAFRRIEKLGTEGDMDALVRGIARKALDAEWDVAHRQLVSEMKVDVPEGEDAILAEAVRLSR
jgi:hypothetical protein